MGKKQRNTERSHFAFRQKNTNYALNRTSDEIIKKKEIVQQKNKKWGEVEVGHVIVDTKPAKNLLVIGEDLIPVLDLEVQNATVAEMETLEAQDINHTDQAVIIAEIDGDPVIQIYQAVIIPEIVVRTQMFRLNLLSELFP